MTAELIMTNPLHDATTAANTDSPTGDVDVFVIDDHAGYRSLVAEVLAATDGFELVGTASSWAVAVNELETGTSLPDLVLMDVNLGDDSGVDAATELAGRWPEVKIILISTLAQADLPPAAQSSGAAGFLPKSLLSPAEISQAWLGTYDWQP